MIGEMQHELSAGPGATGLDETEVASGDLGTDGEVELAEAATLSPVAQEVTDSRCR
jgi:hypothetical protein